MNAPQFTPGPWVSRGLTIWEPDKTAMSIAVVTQHHKDARANARLISAAPDLYEALVLAAAVIDRAGIIWMGEAKCQAALARARGEHS